MAEPASGYSSSHRFYGDFERADTSTKLHMILDNTRKEGSGARSSLDNIKSLARGSESWVKVIHSVAMDLVNNEPSRIKQDIEKAGCLDSVSLDSSHSKIGGEATFVNRKLLDSCGYVSGSGSEHDPFILKGPIPSQLKEAVVHQQELGNSAYPLRTMKLEGHGPVTLPALTRQPSRKMPKSGGIPQRMHKESRTKLLELNDVPVKSRRRKTVDAEQAANKLGTSVPDTPPAKKPPATPTVPEYAAGLGFDTPDLPPVPTSAPSLPTPSLAQTTPTLPSPKQPQQPATSTSTKQQTPLTPTVFKTPKFSPVQLSIAEEMFREAPHLTQDQKHMIMGFLSGVTENPHPEQGSVVSVPLTKVVRQEQFSDAEGHKGIKTYSIETIFEMNYSTGQWRKLQLKRPIKTDAFGT